MRKPSQWKHKSKKEVREGGYEFTGRTHQRVFTLSGKKNVLQFGSWQQAKTAGWHK